VRVLDEGDDAHLCSTFAFDPSSGRGWALKRIHLVDSLDARGPYLGVRRSQGIDLHDFLKHFGAEALDRYELVLQELQSEGFVHRENNTVTLTAQGIVLSDSVYERLA